MIRKPMSLLFLALLAGAVFAPAATAEEAKKQRAPEMASDEEVAVLMEEFKEAYKAKGLRGTDKVMQRDFAMRMIAGLHHPEVVDALGKAARSSNDDVALIAVIYLGDQVLLPHEAAKHILKTMKRNRKDVVMQMTGLQSLGKLRYLGASHEIRKLLKDRQFILRKTAITTVGDIGDVRLLDEVLEVLGVKLETDNKGGSEPDKKESKKEVTEEGYSWEGAEAVVDRGEADNTQENADAKKIAEAKIAANKAAAMAAAGKGGGGSGGVSGMGGSGGRGGTARSSEEMIPAILRTLKKLTGEEFRKPSQIRTWLREKDDWLETEKKRLDEREKAQKSRK